MGQDWAAKGWMTTQVGGMKELDRALSVLPDQLAQKVLRQAVAAGAGVMKREAKRRCPRKTGRLAKSIKFKYKRVSRGYRRGQVIYQVGPSEKYGHLVEFGTSPHVIKPSYSRRVRTKLQTGRTIAHSGLGYKGRFGKKVNHPGAAAQPYLRPAFDEGYGEIIKAMRRRIGVGIEREARKLARANIAARRLARSGG